MATLHLRLATRASALALFQANAVSDALCLANPGLHVELVPTSTMGDRQRDVAIAQLGGQGVFVKEVQQLLFSGEADFAVHSAKDLPSTTMDGLLLAAITERADVRDCLVGRTLAGLGPGATVACGAPRRRAVLAEQRPDLNLVELRGNIATRVEKSRERGIDAVVVAVAALQRLGLDHEIAEILDPTIWIPQVGQGALAIECRADDPITLAALRSVDHAATRRAVEAERAFLAELGAGCSVPAGAWAVLAGGTLAMRGLLASPDGDQVLRTMATGIEPEALGKLVAGRLRDQLGGAALMEQWQRARGDTTE